MIRATTMAARLAAGTLLVCAAGAAQRAQADVFNITGEAPGVQNSTASFATFGVETFNSYTASGPDGLGGLLPQNLTSNFGGGVSGLSASIDNITLLPPDIYGGAGGTGLYASDAAGSITVTLNQPVTYFGLWVSAMNDGNVISIYNGDTLLTSFDTAGMAALIGSDPAYFGNPNIPGPGNDPSEPFAFVNFFDETGSFDKIVIGSDGTFESDNYTVGTFTAESGTSVIPEPASIALLGAGFASFGMLRRRRKST